MNFSEVEITQDEFKILSRLVTGDSMSYKLSAITSPYILRLQKLNFLSSERISDDGEFNVTEEEFKARITDLGENYFIYVLNKRRQERFSRRHTIINSIIAVLALAVAIFALFL